MVKEQPRSQGLFPGLGSEKARGTRLVKELDLISGGRGFKSRSDHLTGVVSW